MVVAFFAAFTSLKFQYFRKKGWREKFQNIGGGGFLPSVSFHSSVSSAFEKLKLEMVKLARIQLGRDIFGVKGDLDLRRLLFQLTQCTGL